jgi:pimeloyl-ACP methyl ester carboxylesterase
MITRREFSLAMGVAAVAATSAAACSSTPPAAPPTSAGRTSFPALKQVDAGLLNVGYAEDGPADGPPVILLHGWPYDIYSYVDVAPVLAAKGYRVIVPYLRGFGTTHFLSDKTFRNGQQAALAADIVAFMDALKIPQAVIGGFDWGARTACVIAALWPQRCKALVSVSGYLIVNLASNLKPLAPQAELGGGTSTTRWIGNSQACRRSRCRPSRSPAISTAPPKTAAPTASCSPADTTIEFSTG